MKRHNPTLRNIGIIAHVDAGKTTVTERVLLFTGKIHKAGDVHHGNTTTDTGKSEILHGITISAAAVSVSWRDHEINVIDTPGHVDFNMDVRSALRVLDGAVVVFDAVAGVEPQTETNWRLANDYHVARIAFVNKLDRLGASFEKVCAMIRERLNVIPLPLQVPLGEGDAFEGMIDLIEGKVLLWPDPGGKEVETHPIPESELERVQIARQDLAEILADYDDEVADAFLAGAEMPVEGAKRAIRKGIALGTFVPVLGGSALKNKGVPPLLDAIVDYLPSPDDVPLSEELEGVEQVSAFVFKTAADESFGQLSYCRVYSGELKPGDNLWNARERKRERVSRIYRMQAGKKEPVESATAGAIVALSGLKSACTGDTLTEPGLDLVLEGMTIPEPVTSVVLEAENRDQKDKLAKGLERLLREDPTLRLSTNRETGQILLSGMGELHLQIACEELENRHNVHVVTGPPQVSYRESVTDSAEATYRLKKQSSGPGQFAQVTLRLEPLESGAGMEFVDAIRGGVIPAEYIPAVERGVRMQAETGILAGYPFVDFRVTLLDGQTHSNDSSSLAFETAGARAFREAALKAMPYLLEPLMRVSVTVPEENFGAIIGDLSRRRGRIESQQEQGSVFEIQALVPLANMFGYIGDLRSLTGGRGTFTMELAHYAPVPAQEQERILAA